MVDYRAHPNDVNQSNGRQNTLRRSFEELGVENATRGDYPIHLSSAVHGTFWVIEKPAIIEVYTICLVSLSTPAVKGYIFTSCIKLIGRSAQSQQRIRKYPTKIFVLSGYEDKGVEETPDLVKGLIIFKQEISLFIKTNHCQDYFKTHNSYHIRFLVVSETNLSNIMSFAADNKKSYELADENNQCHCRQFLEHMPPEKPCAETELSLCTQSASNTCNQPQVHICMFCGQGFYGGYSCGRVCDKLLKQKISKKNQPIAKPPKKKKKCCGCLRKNRTKEDVKQSDSRIKGNKRLFGKFKKSSAVYIKKPTSPKDQSLNIVSVQKTLRSSEEPSPTHAPHKYSSVSPEKNPPQRHSSVSPEKLKHPIGYPPSLWHKNKCYFCRCTPPFSECREKLTYVCKCHNDCLLNIASKTQIYKSRSEKLVGKRFHLICHKFESSDEETDISTVPANKHKSPNKINKVMLAGSSSQETELPGDVKKRLNEKKEIEAKVARVEKNENKADRVGKNETKVGRMEINYNKNYYSSNPRLQRDNVFSKDGHSSSCTYSSSKPNLSMSSSNSNVSYLNIREQKSKRSKFPVKFEDCKSCYLKICKRDSKKRAVVCYSSSCSMKDIS